MIDLVKHSSHAPPASDSRQKAVDTGMAITLICLIIGLWRANTGWFVSAAAILVINMTMPNVFRPASRLWFGFSGFLGGIMSRVILAAVYYTVLTPVGLLRRAMGKDSLKIAAFKKSSDSVFLERSTPFTAADLKTPF